MIAIPEAGSQSVLIGSLLFILRVMDRLTQPNRKKTEPDKEELRARTEDLIARINELTTEVERLGRNKADRFLVIHMERRISDAELTLADLQRRAGA